MVDDVKRESLPSVWLGDYNAATWTPSLSAIRAAGLVEAQDQTKLRRGVTWPTNAQGNNFRVLPMVRIDNIFLGGGAVARDAGIGHSTGSDHRPVFADIQLP